MAVVQPPPAMRNQAIKAARAMGREYGVAKLLKPSLLFGVFNQESGWNPTAGSPAGARGIGQLMPETARGLGVKNVLNWRQNMMGSARYLAMQLRKFKSVPLALSAYNSGPGGSESSGRVENFAETQNYVKKVMAFEKQYAKVGGSAKMPISRVADTPARLADDAYNYQPSPAAQGHFQSRSPVAAVMTPGRSYLANLARMGPMSAKLAAQVESMSQIPLPRPLQYVPGKQPKNGANPKLPPVRTATGKVKPIPVVVEAGHGRISPKIASVIRLAEQYQGTPYSWGGGGPGGPSRGTQQGANTVGFDCSSFLQFVYARHGVSIPRVTYEQWKTGTRVSRKGLMPGDAVFFRPGPRGPEHVGMYIGNGKFIQAPKTGDVVKISSINDQYYRENFMGGRRYINTPATRRPPSAPRRPQPRPKTRPKAAAPRGGTR